MDEDFLDTLLRAILPGRDRGRVRESDPARTFVERLMNPPVVPEGTHAGPGAMEYLSPEGAAFAPMTAANAGSRAFNMADDVGFLRRLFGDIDPRHISHAMETEGSELAQQLAGTRKDSFEGLYNKITALAEGRGIPRLTEAERLRASRALGGANIMESQRGRAAMDVLRNELGLSPTESVARIDQSIIETLLRSVGGR